MYIWFSFHVKNQCGHFCFIKIDLGLQQHRLDGDEYIAVIDEFMEAVFTRWPNVVVQVLSVLIRTYPNILKLVKETTSL